MENIVVLLRLLGVELEEGLPGKRVVRGSDLVTNIEHVPNIRIKAFPETSRNESMAFIRPGIGFSGKILLLSAAQKEERLREM